MKKMKISNLRPTQFALGMDEVREKIRDFKKMSSKELEDYMKANPIPVVISEAKHAYVADHHHALYCYWEMDLKKAYTVVCKDYSDLNFSYLRFWKKMMNASKVYLYDQFGEGPRSPIYLPLHVNAMADDPYRSLAWMVRKAGGYQNTSETFSEFRWANFFRKKRLIEKYGRERMEKCIKPALKLAKSKEAKKLPGFIGKK